MTSLDAAAGPTGSTAERRVDLVLEGGGVKGVALAGALEVLEERGYRVNRVAGASAGAVAGALITAGIPASTIVQILRETDYRRFADGPAWTRFPPGAALSVLLHQGIHRGERLRAWIEEQLTAHGAPGSTGTFADLVYRDPDPERTAVSGPPYRLVVTVSDLSSGRLRYLPTDADDLGTTPETLRVADAVRASTAIPLFFRPERWTSATGTTSWLVDGGMLSNFPVSVFDRPAGEVPRWPTLGIKLSAKPEADHGVAHRITGPLSYGRAVLDTVTGFYDRLHVDASDAVARTIFIDTDAVRPTEFDLEEESREQLYRSGRQAATSFLDGDDDHEPWDFARYVETFRGGRPASSPA
ncbi:patatin-like phospholipase family protein [Brachybacterium sp. YJGR34]|uniref:patatin-like phospholipase family protein n=1 Tax=Brachybacterium sp. YJGR34 TaxID=2059911 RepID=UPI000E0A69B4|nr:patatin-like phospholipase family protein [Brachybacterium sp. YJGR34]